MTRSTETGFLALVLVVAGLALAVPAGAQDAQGEDTKQTATFDTPTPSGIPAEQEALLRALLAPKLDRSDEGLVMTVDPDGGISMDPQGRLQSVVLARIGEDGRLQVYSFDELEPAMHFLTFEIPTPQPAGGETAVE
ncbi:MAG TPA: hypothetical protein VLT32_23175 [Candidatus Sulfomarinibacteraceae bacterium]|nr:hypothetical protein [Candidatus Sulfomarinibacteraceae bacterium]